MNMKSANKITRFGYIVNKRDISEKLLVEIKKELTMKPYKPGNYGMFAKNDHFPIYFEDENYISIPKYYGIEKLGLPSVNKVETFKYPTFDMEYLGELRPHQQTIVNKVFDAFANNRGGLVIAGCGSGKTNIAIYIACKYKLKTLFIVHKGFLKDQVTDRVLSTTNISRIGTIQRATVDIDSPFVVGMIQSLAKIDYDDNIFKDFGLIIIDEVHHMAARNFSRVYQKISSKYMLGISAEHQRMDGLYKIINWYMGPIIHYEEQKPNDMVIVKKYNYHTSNRKRIKMVENKFTGEPDRSTMITNLVYIKQRNRFIIEIIDTLYEIGKNILCLTGRIEQVNLLYYLLDNKKTMYGNVGKYIGGMNEDELQQSATKQIIIGTYGMAEEGLDISNLNVVILCTPKSAIKQSVGRILRKEIYEEHPMVIDIVDIDNQVFTAQGRKRADYYKKKRYNIQNFSVYDYDSDESRWTKDQIVESIMKVPEKKSRSINDICDLDGSDIDCDKIDFLDD